MPLAVCNGIQLAYDDTDPQGHKPLVVFLHGHGLNRSMWDHQKQALREQFRVVAYDLRGHGRSEKPKTGYSRTTEVADLAALLEVLRGRKVYLVGLSRGAGIALEFAATHATKMASVVAIGAGYDHQRHMPDFAEQRMQTMATLRAEGLRAAREYWESLPIFAPLKENQEAARKAEDMLLSYTGCHWLDPDPPKDGSLLDVAGKIQARCLLLVGERDLPGFHACADELAAAIPNAEKKVVPGVGHLAAIEAPEEMTAHIRESLTKG